MKKIILSAFIFSFFVTTILVVVSCAMHSSYFTGPGLDVGNKNFRESFLKVENQFSTKECDDKGSKCTIQRIISSASAFVVSSGKNGSYAITAAHFCEDDMDLLLQSVIKGMPIQKIKFHAYDNEMKKHDVNIIHYNRKLDLCLLYIKKLQKKPVLISQQSPEPGDKAYNLAAPLGIFYNNMIPKLDGYFAGLFSRNPKDGEQEFAIYSIPAIGGSSGSPIFDNNGYVIGMIHSVNTRFPFLTYSPTQEQLRQFINENVPY